MSLVSKLKNILFEEEEIEIPVLEKKEKVEERPVIREMPKKEEVRQVPDYSSFYDEEPLKAEPPREPVQPVAPAPEPVRYQQPKPNMETVSEREMFKSEKTFNFPAFDEQEFESALPRRSTNVLEHERKKHAKKEIQNNVRQEEVSNDKNKFRPSPIISPVYGILDKNYTPDDITTRDNTPRPLDVDSVRKKAFGTLEEEIINIPEPVYQKDDLDEKIYEEKLEKARTIDELLKDSSDDIIEVPSDYLDTSAILQDEDLEDTNDIIDTLNETIESLEETREINTLQDSTDDETLESDLFDLIDSMYENREDGE